MAELILYSHRGCCLCDRLEEMLRPHVDRLNRSTPVTLVKRDVANDPTWLELYRERIPVLTVDGQVLLEGRPEPEEVAAALAALLPNPR